MKLLAFGDLHLINENIIDNAIINCIKEKIEKDSIIVFLGDVFNDFNIGLKNTSFYEFIAKLDNKIYILMGNHDISKGRGSFRNIKFFSENIKIIENYYYEDIENHRLHFYNFFRYQTDQKFEIDGNKKNVLFTHCDNPFVFNKFDLVVNGHNHDFEQKNNIINLGAIRQVASNETRDKKYLILKDKYELFDFKSPVNIEKIFYKDLNDIKEFETPTILRVLLSGYEDKKEVESKCNQIKNCIVKQENYKDDNVILKIVNELQESVKFDFQNIFKQYLDFYIEKFKADDLDKKKLIKLFNKIYLDESVNKEFDFESFNIKFNNVRGKNFFRFQEIFIDLNNYENNIYLIKGKNYDEIKDNDPSSNGSGKSSFMKLFRYALQGNDIKIKPLTYSEKSGEVELNFEINEDKINIYRKYTKSTNELRIVINDNEEWKDLTNSDKTQLFYEKYKIENSLQFLFLSDTGLSKYFFSSKNSEKFKIFRELFPIIQYISSFVEKVKQKVKIIENEYENLKRQYDNYKNIRKSIAKDCLSFYRRLQQEKEEINIEELKKQINNKFYKEKYKREDLIVLKQLKMDIEDFTIKTFDYTKESIENEKQKVKIIENKKDILDKELRRINNLIKDKEKELSNLINGLKESKCFYCNSIITNKEHINKHVEKINNEINQLFIEKDKEKEFDNLDKEIDNIDIDDLNIKLKILRDYEYDKKDYDKYLHKIKEINYQNEDIDDLLDKIEINREIEIKNNQINREIEIKTQRLLKIQEEKVLLMKQIKQNKLTYDYKSLNLKEEYVKLLEYIIFLSVLNGKRLVNFEKFFINMFFSKFEKIFNVFISFLFDSNIKLFIDEMDFKFKDNDNDTDFNNFSQGEQTKISVALMLTNNSVFKEFGIRSNLLFIDEFLDTGIDEINLERIIKLIKSFYKKELIFLITHKNVESFIDKEIIIERKNNKSYLI